MSMAKEERRRRTLAEFDRLFRAEGGILPRFVEPARSAKPRDFAAAMNRAIEHRLVATWGRKRGKPAEFFVTLASGVAVSRRMTRRELARFVEGYLLGRELTMLHVELALDDPWERSVRR